MIYQVWCLVYTLLEVTAHLRLENNDFDAVVCIKRAFFFFFGDFIFDVTEA